MWVGPNASHPTTRSLRRKICILTRHTLGHWRQIFGLERKSFDNCDNELLSPARGYPFKKFRMTRVPRRESSEALSGRARLRAISSTGSDRNVCGHIAGIRRSAGRRHRAHRRRRSTAAPCIAGRAVDHSTCVVPNDHGHAATCFTSQKVRRKRPVAKPLQIERRTSYDACGDYRYLICAAVRACGCSRQRSEECSCT